MKVVFLGTGEAFDENNPNNSSLIISEKTNLLLDCGFTTPHELWKHNNDQNLLDAVYISHLHADHYFGFPALVMRMWEEGRVKPFTVICQEDISKKIMETAYPGFLQKFNFEIKFQKAEISKEIKLNDLELSFSETKHSGRNLAVRIKSDGKSICYSGDGDFTEETRELYKNSDLVIQETYLYDENKIGHATITDTIKMAEENNIKCLALTHINRNARQEVIDKKPSSEKVKVIIPKPFDEYSI